MSSKLLESSPPNMVTAPIMVMAISEAISAYSMAVDPLLHLKKQMPCIENRLMQANIIFIPAAHFFKDGHPNGVILAISPSGASDMAHMNKSLSYRLLNRDKTLP